MSIDPYTSWADRFACEELTLEAPPDYSDCPTGGERRYVDTLINALLHLVMLYLAPLVTARHFTGDHPVT
jgi:hypothetical protein